MTVRAPKLLFFVTEDWYFCSHRLPLAVAARKAGYEVKIMTRLHQHGDLIRAAGIEVIPLTLARGGVNPFKELRTLISLYRHLRVEQPDILHNVALKPVLYGSLAARMAGIPGLVNAIAGLGHIFVTAQRADLLRKGVTLAFRHLLRGHGTVILQNPDDQALLERSGALAPDQSVLIRGAGVDLDAFRPQTRPDNSPPIVILASRLLWDKGVGEFVAAADRLKSAGVQARFVLVGAPDPENRSSISQEQLDDWQRSGIIEWWGKRADMPEVFAAADLVCLPSYYGEGIPKALIEAAACGRALITTDMPGCREVVRDGENGLLVPPRDAVALADALKRLLENPDLCQRMGAAGRLRAEREFGQDAVIAQTLEVYRRLLKRDGHHPAA